MKAPEAFQSEWELQHLLGIVERLEPQRILEVGAMYGGTLWHWLQHAVLSVVVVDDEMRRASEWEEWEEHFGPDLYLVQGLSQDPEVIEKARSLGPYDFAFIDGDHRYESVSTDYANYGPLAKVVAFHDILPRPGYGVSELWTMLKAQSGARYIEIAQNETLAGNEGSCGIGVLWT